MSAVIAQFQELNANLRDELVQAEDHVLIEHLKARGIDTRTFFWPMNQQPCLQERPGYRAVACPVADEIWETGLYLPSSTTLTDAEIATVCGEIAHAATVAKA